MSNNKKFAPGKSEVLVPELHFPEYMNEGLLGPPMIPKCGKSSYHINFQ